MQWLFMRHGEAWWNTASKQRCHNHAHNVLTPKGIGQVLAAPLEPLMEIDGIVASTYDRAWMTAQLIRSRITDARHERGDVEIGIPFQTDADLVEFWHDGDHDWASSTYYDARADLRQRIERALRRHDRTRQMLFVSHGWVMAEIKAISENRNFIDYYLEAIPHPRQAEVWPFDSEAFF